MNIITGYRGEPHITSSQDRAGNQGSYGTGSYVLDVGNKLAATISSSTQVRIADGAICHQGCLANIDAGTYDAVTINNGAQGVNRIDLIVARYTKDSVTGVESIDLVVIQGSSVSGTPTPPSYRTGNIQNGDSPVDMPLYQVRLNGVTLSSVTAVFSTVKNQAELQADVSTLNGKITSGNSISASDFFTVGNTVTLASSGHSIYKIGNRVYVKLLFSGSVAIPGSGIISVGTLKDAYKPTMQQTCAVVINGAETSTGQVRISASIEIFAGGTLRISTSKNSVTIGNTSYPWSTENGIAFHYDL